MSRRGVVLFSCLLIISSLSGCRFLRNLCPTVCPVITFNNGFQVGFTCKSAGQSCRSGAAQQIAASEVIQAPANYRAPVTPFATVQRAVDLGTEIDGDPACGPVCIPAPESDACDQCRTMVGAGIITPFLSLCLGSAYQFPPATALMAATVTTNSGTYRSQPIQIFQRGGTVRYDNCGAPTADYDFDQQAAESFASYVVNQGATDLRNFYAEQVFLAGTDSTPLVSLTPQASALVEQGRASELDAASTEFGISGWVFQAGGGDPLIGYSSPDGAIMTQQLSGLGRASANGPITITGEGRAQLKPCRSDADCTPWGLVCRPSDIGFVCKAP